MRGTIRYLAVLLPLFVSSVCFAQDFYGQANVKVPIGKNRQTYTVSQVIDGDTFRLSNGQILKLAQVNTPELHNASILHDEAKRFQKDIWAYRNIGGEAHREAQRFLKLSKNQVRWEADSEAFDQDGNLLAYVFVPLERLEEGAVADNVVYFANGAGFEVFLNAYLVKMGLAETVANHDDEEYRELFLKLEEEAKQNKKGLWG